MIYQIRLSPVKRKVLRIICLLFLTIIIGLAATIKAAEFHVSSSNELQQALTEAASNSAADSIYLASGMYAVSDIGGSFTYLAAAGENYPLSIMAEPGATPTLDGGGVYQVLRLENPNGSHTQSHFIIRGLTIQNGKRESRPAYGGGLYCETAGNITVEKNVFQNNEARLAGGGASLHAADTNATVIVADNIFEANSAKGGGGLFCSALGRVLVNDNVFDKNSATGTSTSSEKGGGGILFSESGDVFLEKNEFLENTALNSDGGGIHADDVGLVSLVENKFEGNTSRYVGGGARLISKYDDIILSHNQFLGNKVTGPGGGLGGGIYASSWSDEGNIYLFENTFISNEAASEFGGAFCNTEAGNTEIVNNVFSCNSAYNNGGLRIYACEGATSLTNNTIVCNQALREDGVGGIRLATSGSPNGVINIYNNIIFANCGYDIFNGISQENVAINIVNNKFISYDGYDEHVYFCGNDRTECSPQFVDSTDYHLAQGSPCIDVGCNIAPSIPNYDKDGNPRIVDGDKDGTSIVDRGAYEFMPPPETVFTNYGAAELSEFQLLQNFPNPFNAQTTIRYQIADYAYVKIKMYNISGQLIRTLVNEEKQPGNFVAQWNGRDDFNKLVGSGVYFCKMEIEGIDQHVVQTQKMIYLK